MTTHPSIHSGILADIFGEPGYSTAFSVNAAELDFLRSVICAQWISRIEEKHPEYANQFRENGIDQYHRLSHLVSHDDLWTKNNRVLSKQAVSDLGTFDFSRRIKEAFGESCKISNVFFFDGTAIPDHPELTWRLVRPGVTTDIGGIHADKWFHDIHGKDEKLFADDEVTIKMWLAIYTEPGLNGLCVVPGSHRKSWQIKQKVLADGYPRPSLDEPLDGYEKKLAALQPGQAILFNENLLHSGALNNGVSCRVSLETTLVIKRAAIGL